MVARGVEHGRTGVGVLMGQSTNMGTVRPKSKQGNTTNLNISFSMKNEKKNPAQVGFKPTAYCL